MPISIVNTVIFSGLALIAFAANSVLCRMALGSGLIDAASFTVLRLLSGSIVLGLLVALSRKKQKQARHGSYLAGFMLFTYAATFSYAYTVLDTATGAFILFAVIQISMILISLFGGQRLRGIEWVGMLVAFSGFVYLVSPGVSAPSLQGTVLMTVAGIAWAVYTLLGRATQNPLMDTTYNFIRTLPWVIILLLFTLQSLSATTEGVVLAILSGGITSGLGYALWYRALGDLSSMQAAVLQLLVPIIAAFGGVIFVSEAISQRLVVAAILVLGGILLVVRGRKRNEI